MEQLKNVPNNQKYLDMAHTLLFSHLLICNKHFNRVVYTKMYDVWVSTFQYLGTDTAITSSERYNEDTMN